VIEITERNQTIEKNLRVVLIEDLRDIREGLTALINGTSGFECVASYGMMETALARIEREKPDAILTDLGLPGMSGIEGIARMREIFPNVPIIALTIYDNDREIFDALCNGANGYLLKKHAARQTARSVKGSRDRRFADVADYCRPRRQTVSHVSPARTR